MAFFSNRDTDESDDSDGDTLAPEEIASDATTWRARAADLIPGGASTGSKRPDALYGPETNFGPTHFETAVGCRLISTDGAELIDCSMALGAVALGYVEPSVTEAVINVARAGNVTGLSHTLEVEIAERLTAVIPCAEQVRFLKTGAEAIAAAVRIARAHTGRSHVIGCGYFGWLGWWKAAAGLPAGAHSDFEAIAFDDADALYEAAKRSKSDLAAIVIEPVIERLPSEEWINVARRACDDYGAVLIFDEIKTGFRLRQGGYQEYSGITPDLSAFGKAMANGFPLAAVVGKRGVMDAARSTWISSTLASEGCALAAAGAVLDWHERAEVSEALWSIGGDLVSAVTRAITASRVNGVSVDGIAPMWFLRFEDASRESRFLELALREGVLFKRGAYNFASLAHDDDTIAAIEGAASAAFVALREEAP